MEIQSTTVSYTPRKDAKKKLNLDSVALGGKESLLKPNRPATTKEIRNMKKNLRLRTPKAPKPAGMTELVWIKHNSDKEQARCLEIKERKEAGHCTTCPVLVKTHEKNKCYVMMEYTKNDPHGALMHYTNDNKILRLWARAELGGSPGLPVPKGTKGTSPISISDSEDSKSNDSLNTDYSDESGDEKSNACIVIKNKASTAESKSDSIKERKIARLIKKKERRAKISSIMQLLAVLNNARKSICSGTKTAASNKAQLNKVYEEIIAVFEKKYYLQERWVETKEKRDLRLNRMKEKFRLFS